MPADLDTIKSLNISHNCINQFGIRDVHKYEFYLVFTYPGSRWPLWNAEQAVIKCPRGHLWKKKMDDLCLTVPNGRWACTAPKAHTYLLISAPSYITTTNSVRPGRSLSFWANHLTATHIPITVPPYRAWNNKIPITGRKKKVRRKRRSRKITNGVIKPQMSK